MSITKDMLKQLRADMDKALETVAVKHGLIINTGNMSFNASEVNIKVKAMVKGEGVTNKEEAEGAKFAKDFLAYVGLYGDKLTKDDLGATFKHNNKIFTIVGWDAKKHKLPIIIKDQNGTQFKSSVEQVVRGLGR